MATKVDGIGPPPLGQESKRQAFCENKSESMNNINISFALVAMLSGPMLAVDLAQPNIIVILADDMGWPDLGVQNVHQDLKTPNLDALA